MALLTDEDQIGYFSQGISQEEERICMIAYEHENFRLISSPCGGVIEKREVFIRSEVSLGGPPPVPFDTYGVCTKCKVRFDW
jgi:hypothetical protein